VQEVVGREAFGKPGIEPRWTHSNKSGVGTSDSASSHLWFTMRTGEILRVQGEAAFILHRSSDNWKTVRDTQSSQNSLQIDYVDLPDVATSSGTCIRFTFFRTEGNRWKGQDYTVTVH
jgi:hypothetical protein